MSAPNSEDLNNKNQSLVDGDDTYPDSYDEDVNTLDDTSDDWADDEPSDDDKAQEKPAKKKSKSTTFIIIAVVVLAGLGFVFLSGGSQPVPVDQTADMPIVAEQTAEVQPNVAQEIPVIEQPPVTPQNQSGMMDNPAVVADIANQNQAAVVMSASPSDMEIQAPEPAPASALEPAPTIEVAQAPVESLEKEVKDDSVVENNVVDMVAPDIKPVSDFPTADSIKKPEVDDLQAQQIVTSTPKSSETLDNVAVPEIDPKLTEAQTKLDEAQKRILELENTISVKEAELSEQKLNPPIEDKTEEIEALKSKISDLEQKLEVATNPKPSEIVPTEDKNIESKAESKEEVKEISNIGVPVKQEVKINKAKPAWVLKGANSRTAIIYNKTNGDMKTIAVGDEVEGLGKILSISLENASWSVKATKGNVSE